MATVIPGSIQAIVIGPSWSRCDGSGNREDCAKVFAFLRPTLDM